MLNKIYTFQKVLFSSFALSEYNPALSEKENAKGCSRFLWFALFSIPIIMFFMQFYVLLFFCLVGAIYQYMTINGKKKSYLLMPVSRKFALLNIYIFPYTFFIVIILGYLIAILAVGIPLMLLDPVTSENTVPNDFGIKTLILGLLLILVSNFVVTAISLIQKRKTRLISLGIYLFAVGIFFTGLKYSMPVVDSSSDFLNIPEFEAFSSATPILITMAILLALIIPSSIIFSSRTFLRHTK